MFEIPSDLPLRLSALAWLLGHWQGWGTIAAPGSKPSPVSDQAGRVGESGAEATESGAQSTETGAARTPGDAGAPVEGGERPYLPVLQDIHADVVDQQMRMTIRTYEGALEGDFDPLWTAGQGLDAIAPGGLISEETTYWSVDTPLAVVPAGPDEPRELRAVGSGTRGFAIMWAGVAMGPRIQLASDAVARVPRADALDHFTRMFGLVGGELMWASESMPRGGEYEVEITGRLQRAARSDADE